MRRNPLNVKTMLLSAAVGLALAYGLTGLRWGLPALWYPDEPETLEQIVIPMARNLDLNPHIFHKGSLYYYFLLAVLSPYFAAVKLLRLPVDDYEALVGRVALIARAATAAVGAFGVWLMARVARRMTGETAARLAAAALAVNVAYAAYSHFAYMEVPLVVMLLVCLFFALRFLETSATADLARTGLTGGMAVSVKYNAAAFVAVILLILLWSRAVRDARSAAAGTGMRGRIRAGWGALPVRHGLIAAGLTAAGFLLTTPFAVLDRRTFMAFMTKQSIIAREGYKVFAASSAWTGNFELLAACFGPVLFPLVLAAWAGLLIRWIFRPSGREALVVWPPLVYYLYIGTWRITAVRYVLPMVPFLILSAVIVLGFLTAAGKRWKRPVLAAALAVLAFSAFRSYEGMLCFSRDTRTRAERWMERNVAAGSRIEAYSYKMYLPSVPAGRVSERISPDFVPDSPGLGVGEPGVSSAPGAGKADNRREFTKEALKRRSPDYILLSSFYDERYMPSPSNRTAELFPELSRYYRDLTDGSAGYGVAAVFTGERMREFYVNPTITILKRLE